MRSSPKVSLLLALIFGAAAAFLVRGLLLNMPGEANAAVRTIVVARGPIAYGSALRADDLREVPWRATEAPDGAFGAIRDVTEDGRRIALASFQRHEPILAAKITAPNQRASLSTQIEDGMRAVTIRVDEVRGVAGFVLPGDRVDVVLTRGEGGGQDASAFADMLLQNAKVLAVDQIAAEGQDKPTVARAVTLELSLQQAQSVILAQGIGRLSLVLRQMHEGQSAPTNRVTASDLGSGQPGERDRIAEYEKRIAEMTRAEEEARAQAERRMAERLAEMEERIRREMTRAPAPASPPAGASPPSSVVKVIRNGTKTEEYTVSAER